MIDLSRAVKLLAACEQKIIDAETERDQAQAQVDQALAERGWHRMDALVSPGVVLYTSPFGGTVAKLDEALRMIEQQKAAVS